MFLIFKSIFCIKFYSTETRPCTLHCTKCTILIAWAKIIVDVFTRISHDMDMTVHGARSWNGFKARGRLNVC